MKFGQHLTAHVTPEWRTQYINYDDMKELLEKVPQHAPAQLGGTGSEEERQQKSTDLLHFVVQFEENFFTYCDRELTKVNTFFAEKLAEAQRKFAALRSELKAHKSRPEHADDRVHKMPWLADLVDKDVRKAKRRYRKIHDLKMAFSEFYLSLILLQNFQNLNFTGFRKILKKHDKILNTHSGTLWRQEKVETAPFHTSKEIEKLILDTENLYVSDLEGGNRGKAMQRLRVPPLNEPAPPSVFFLMGLFLGIFLVLLVVLILTGIFIGFPNNEWKIVTANGTVNGTQMDLIAEKKEIVDWRIVTRLYRGPFLLIIMLFLFAFNVHGWRAAGVNHVLIFELDPRNHLSQHHIMELAACMGVLWCISLLLFFYSDFLGISHYALPLIFSGLMLIFFINPFHVLCYDARKWVIKIMFRVITAPLHPVGFADFWLGDQFTSLTPAFLDIEYSVCFYIFEVPWVTKGIPHPSKMCTSNSNAIRPILAALPAWFRFAQCLRRYRDSKLAFPHLVNAGKYSMLFFVVLFSALNSMHVERYAEDFIGERPVFYMWVITAVVSSCYSFAWDIRMDWGFLDPNAKEHLFLRDGLIYPQLWYYYLAIVQDFILRFAWTISISVDELGLIHHELLLAFLATLELFRRFVWNFFRLENEHLNNCGEFRAVRDLGVSAMAAGRPIQKDSGVLVRMLEREDSEAVRGKAKFFSILSRFYFSAVLFIQFWTVLSTSTTQQCISDLSIR
ncbi:xenotropic and polytropic retrovirus receptor 1 homolog isoform X2 [Paramacrobiotus metropolitanus]|uniref:xenotropic and polytropic retrovirus receptor 1 homolog isoform X2 n=1 Tax=Paramacrobiotus metropolitanus TaxID=2943436 RepID=UPI002445DF01|nr:xenotropic and polytropic retrovirus receptor 1 homolog isoform X2 [Paramacrobiotus metropolitanus]